MKDWLKDFPTHNAAVATALVLILGTGVTVIVKLALGHIFPDGYGEWLWILVALSGFNVAGMGVKRFSDIDYKKAGTSPVSVNDNDNVNVTSTQEVATAPTGAATVAVTTAPSEGERGE